MSSNKRFLTTRTLILITIVAIINLRNIPMMAEQGLHVIWDYAIAAIGFLIPSALICAQSASELPEAGGVYHWVQAAFGDRWGFFTIWSEWFNNLIGFPATLLFISDTVLHAVMPQTHAFNLILTVVMLVLLWLVTYLNCRGIKLSTQLSSYGAIIGTLIPACIIAIIALLFFHKHSMHIAHQVSMHGSVLSTLAILVTCMAGYSGMQVTAFHTPNIITQRKTLPKALLVSIIIILLLTILPTLAVIFIVPHQQLNMITGIWQCLQTFFHDHLWLAAIVLICICIGTLASLSTWMLAPARGLLQSAQDKFLPSFFNHTNQEESPTRILIMQAVVVTLFILWLFASQHLTQGFWILAVLTSQFTLVMYCFIFAASVKNRWKISLTRQQGFEISKIATVIAATFGIVFCIVGYVLSYFKPNFLTGISASHYHHDLLLATVIYILVPIYFILKQKKQMQSQL